MRIAIILLLLISKLGIAQSLPEGFVFENAAPGAEFDIIIGIAFAPDGRLFVIEKSGLVFVIESGTKQETPFLNLEDEVANIGDMGLLSIATDPDFRNNGFVYLYYSVDPNQDGLDEEDEGTFGRLVRYTAKSDNPNQADPESRLVLIGKEWQDGVPLCHLSHAGGSIRFGTDGTLLLSTGDGASFFGEDLGGQTPDCFKPGRIDSTQDIGKFRSQDISTLSGKILRLDRETGLGLPSNPYFTGNPDDTQSKVWAYGLRNPFRFAVRENGATNPDLGQPGSIYVCDVGDGRWEEVSVSTTGGENFGWPCHEGPQTLNLADSSKCANIGSFENPVTPKLPLVSIHHSDPNLSSPPGAIGRSIITGAFYTGTKYPAEYRDTLFFGDYVNGWIQVLRVDEADNLMEVFDFADLSISSVVDFQSHPMSGDIYFAHLSGQRVYRIRYTGGVEENQAPVAIASADTLWGYTPLAVHFKGSDSYDPDSDSLTFSWSLGNGAMAKIPNPIYSYSENGIFHVELTVTDEDGLQSKYSLDIVVGSTPPEAIILSPVNGSSFSATEIISMEGNAVDPDEPEENLLYNWQVILHHNSHTHPQFFSFDGKLGIYRTPAHGDDDDFYYVEFELRVRDSQGLSDIAKSFVIIKVESEIDITDLGSPLALITAPSGSGNPDIEVIRDNQFPPVDSGDPMQQYDTSTGVGGRSEDWIGYEFPTSHIFSKIIFQEGIHFDDGGWLDSLFVQVRANGVWGNVSFLNCIPPYLSNNDINYETFTLLFKPQSGDAVRLIGAPGGINNFISVGELRIIENDFTVSVEDNPSMVPTEFGLLQNYPNPFNATTVIPYHLSSFGHAEVAIYNQLGKRVKTLISEKQPAGSYELHWDGLESNGTSVASGIYLYRIKTNSFTQVRKMLLLR